MQAVTLKQLSELPTPLLRAAVYQSYEDAYALFEKDALAGFNTLLQTSLALSVEGQRALIPAILGRLQTLADASVKHDTAPSLTPGEARAITSFGQFVALSAKIGLGCLRVRQELDRRKAMDG